MEPDQQFLDYVVKAIVDHPDDVVIERTVDNMGVLLTLTVHPDDMGKVIGKQGKIAQEALRPLLRIVGMKHNARVNLKINEPVGGKRLEGGMTTGGVLDEMDKTIEDLKG
ncbi:MAG: KH domain-containing protein [Patescibacteria group bacterium]|nr:KH domain-containing protein [Patescibacteria group bacterium]MDE1966074.1 KH domain-containing protein [Patescibacteria group bacterium]